MAMRKSSRRELAKLREFAMHFLEGLDCHFCGKPLLPRELLAEHEPGSGCGPVLVDVITGIAEHHVNHDHHDNRKRNRVWCHKTCHRRHHASGDTRVAGGRFSGIYAA
jgi:hypothetical protein